MTFTSPESATLRSFGEPTGTDGDGNDLYTPTLSTVAGAFDPGGSVETTVNGDIVVTQPTFYIRGPVDLPAAIDQLTVRGITFNVAGDPAAWVSPYSSGSVGTVIRLKGVTG